MEILVKDYAEISKEELYDILHLRAKVFVVEQDSPYQDLDYKDQYSKHLLMMDEEELAGYLRIIPESDEELSIGRVIVNPDYRGKELGKKIMKYAIKYAFDNFTQEVIIIDGQKRLEKFYSEFGFEVISDEYILDNIPHYKMKLVK